MAAVAIGRRAVRAAGQPVERIIAVGLGVRRAGQRAGGQRRATAGRAAGPRPHQPVLAVVTERLVVGARRQRRVGRHHVAHRVELARC